MKSIPLELLKGPVVFEGQVTDVTKCVSFEIFRDYAPKNIVPILLCIDKGANFFLRKLKGFFGIRGFKFDEAHLDVSSYVNDESTGVVKIGKYTGPPLAGRYVIVVEDIIDTALTMKEIVKWLEEKGVAGWEIATLLFKRKPQNLLWRMFGLRGVFGYPRVRYAGVFIKNWFVVGCGLDFEECGRTLLDIYIMTAEAIDWVKRQKKVEN